MSSVETPTSQAKSSAVGKAGVTWVSQVFTIAAGVLLCLAGVLKLADPVLPTEENALGMVPMWAVAVLDLIVGTTLLLRPARSIRLLAGLLLAAYAVFNGVRVARGGVVCDCFGQFEAPLLAVLTVDALLAAGLLASLTFGHRHRLDGHSNLVLALGVASLLFGLQVRAAVTREDAMLRVSDTQLESIVDNRLGHDQHWDILVENQGTQTERLLGWTTTCSNLIVETPLPIAIEPASRQVIRVSFRKSPENVPFEIAHEIWEQLGGNLEAALNSSASHELRFLSDREGRVEFTIRHTQMVSPALVMDIFDSTMER